MELVTRPTLFGVRVQIHPGRGLVVNLGTAVLVVIPEDDGQDVTVDGLITELEGAVAEDPGTPARAVARRFAHILSQAGPGRTPPMGVIAVMEEGLAVLAHGPIEIEVRSATSSQTFSGLDAITWVDRVIQRTFESLVVRGAGAPAASLDPRSNLLMGTVPGCGITVTQDARASAARALVPAPSSERFEPVPTGHPPPRETTIVPGLGAPDREHGGREGQHPLPASPPGAPMVDGSMIDGRLCPSGHFNDPTVHACAVCGQGLLPDVRCAPRPALGRLVLDDGSSIDLDGDYVIGREPLDDEGVRAGTVRPFFLGETDDGASRVHARITVDGWDVLLTDQSANGTFIASPPATEWARLPHDASVAIRPGTRLLLGQRTFVFEARRA